MTKPARERIFISYSHKDQTWLDRLLKMMSPMIGNQSLPVWIDRQIKPGQDWKKEIDKALAAAAVGVLLVSPDFLASDFINTEELPYLLVAAEREGVQIVWLLLDHCRYDATPLKPVQAAHDTARPLKTFRGAAHSKVLVEITRKIEDALTASGALIPGAGPLSQPLKPPPVEAAPTRLRHVAGALIGREEELARLDAAWDDARTHVVVIRAWGGVGKTSLAGHWMGRLAAEGWRGAERVFDWSFYSQGTSEDRAASSDIFFNEALKFFGDPAAAERPLSPWDKGALLAQLVAERPSLLVLDGLEPRQHPPSSPLAGELKDPALATLLKGLAAANPGLCVVTTREHVRDLEPWNANTAPEWGLAHLGEAAGAELLR